MGRGILVAAGFRQTSGVELHVFLWLKKQLFFCNFNMSFLATWVCASDFLKMLPKFKMAARGRTLKFFVGAKTKTFLKKSFAEIQNG